MAETFLLQSSHRRFLRSRLAAGSWIRQIRSDSVHQESCHFLPMEIPPADLFTLPAAPSSRCTQSFYTALLPEFASGITGMMSGKWWKIDRSSATEGAGLPAWAGSPFFANAEALTRTAKSHKDKEHQNSKILEAITPFAVCFS